MTILNEIFETKRHRINDAKRVTDISALQLSARELRRRSEPHRFRTALETPDGINIIAEFKKVSPSKGVINDTIGPADAARQYERGGARAISVLTEEDYFKGSLADLKEIRDAVSIPILRKDFICDEFQIYEAAAAGADAILLIVAALSEGRLRALRSLAEDELGIDALVEVHTEDEMQVACDAGARLIGVNNRDLKTFNVSLDVARGLIVEAAAGTTLVAESGITSRGEIDELAGLGYTGFLIGETLMRSGDPEAALRELVGAF